MQLSATITYIGQSREYHATVNTLGMLHTMIAAQCHVHVMHTHDIVKLTHMNITNKSYRTPDTLWDKACLKR